MNLSRRFNSVAFLAALIVSCASTAWADEAKEKELLAVLRSDAPSAEKAITCKKLAIYGSSESVADLAKLLPDPQLASWARIALEAIPGEASDAALRKATESLEGRLLVGTINSIGVRKDANAVELLTARLQDKDADVAAAAAVALGYIGNAGATKSLQGSLASAPPAVRSAVAEGLVLCAEQLHAAGKSAEAVAIYDEVRKAEVPKQRIVEATRGAILARKAEGIPLLLEQLRSSDKVFFNLGLSTAREFPGADVDKSLAAELDQATPERGALIIQAMADRKETVVVAAIAKAAASGKKPVRLAAIGALSRVGDASSLMTLLDLAVDADEDLALAAKATLADLPGEKVDAKIVELLPNAKGKSYPLLIELVGQRRIAATPALVKALSNSDKKVRSAAMLALGETVTLKDLSVLITQVVASKNADDAEVAQQALKTASVRMPDREACATELTSAFDRSPAAAKTVLLQILSDVGGEKALKTVVTAAKSNDPKMQDAGSQLLGKWNGVDSAPTLLDYAKSGPTAAYRVRALKGYIALARRFPMPEPDRVEMCQKAFDLTKQTAEQKLVLDVLKLHPSIEALKMAIKFLEVPELKKDAAEVAVFIAGKLGNKDDVKELLTKAGLQPK